MNWSHKYQRKCMQATKALRECAGASIAIADPRLQAELEDLALRSHSNTYGAKQGTIWSGPDLVNGATYLHEIYTRADPHYTGRATVPVLWDRAKRTIVNNESADIVRMFNAGFGALAESPLDLYPYDIASEIDALNDQMYGGLNNGVYRAGFATTQVAYEDAFKQVFATLDALEARLADGRRFLFGERFTESDIRAFVAIRNDEARRQHRYVLLRRRPGSCTRPHPTRPGPRAS